MLGAQALDLGDERFVVGRDEIGGVHRHLSAVAGELARLRTVERGLQRRREQARVDRAQPLVDVRACARIILARAAPLLEVVAARRSLSLLIASADKARERGIDWCQGDPFLSGRRDRGELEDRLRRLEAKAGLGDAQEKA